MKRIQTLIDLTRGVEQQTDAKNEMCFTVMKYVSVCEIFMDKTIIKMSVSAHLAIVIPMLVLE